MRRNFPKVLEQMAQNLTLSGALSTRTWAEHQVKRGRLDKEWLDLLPQLRKILQEIYPDSWDIYINITVINASPLPSRQVVNPDYIVWLNRLNELERTSEFEEWADDPEIQNHHELEPDEYLPSPIVKYKYQISFSPVIRFPEVKVSNSKGSSVKIQDLFFKFDITHQGNGMFRYQILRGVRTTITQRQFRAKYYHSHLDCGMPRMQFHHFCTGTAEIGQLAAMMNGNEFNPDVFKMFLLQLTTVAGWESLEGGPYQRINGIPPLKAPTLTSEETVASNTILAGRLSTYDTKLHSNKFIRKMKEAGVSLNWTISDNKPVIIDDDTFRSALLYAGENIEGYDKDTLSSLNADGVEIMLNPSDYRIRDRRLERQPQIILETPPRPEEFIPFRGEKIHFVLIPDPSYEEQVKKYEEEKKKREEERKKRELEAKAQVISNIFVNSLIKEHVKQQLEAAAYYYTFRQGIAQRLNPEGYNASANTRQNQIPMQSDF